MTKTEHDLHMSHLIDKLNELFNGEKSNDVISVCTSMLIRAIAQTVETNAERIDAIDFIYDVMCDGVIEFPERQPMQ
jgi:hypothetical protein